MNKDEDGDGGAAALVPPPKTSDMSFRAPAMERSVAPSQPLPPSGEDAPTMDVVPTKLPTGNSNMFKLQKGRSMRANYVDVMNPGGGKPKTGPASSTPMTSPLVPMATSSPQLFIPTPSKSPSFNYSLSSRSRVNFAPSSSYTEQTRCFKTLKKIYS